MTLNTETTFPSRRTYIIRVRGDARPYALSGRLENLVSGKAAEFSSGHELLATIVKDLDAEVHPVPTASQAR